MAINRDKVYDGAIKLLQGGKFEKAIDEFKKLIVDDPKDVRTLLKIAETLHVKMGNRKDALVHYDRAANIYSEQGFFLKAVAVFKQMLTVDATNPDLHKKLAELYQQLGYGSQCLLHYQQVVVLYEQQDRGSETLDILKRMVDLDPENLQSRVKVAELFAQQGRVADASAEMRSAFEYLRGQQRYDDAVRIGEKVLHWDQNASDVAMELAKIYLGRNDAKQALPKLQLCFKVDSRSLEVLELIAQAFLALDQTPKTISVYKEIARIHEGNGDAEKARSSWERVLDLQPGDDDAEISLGRRAATVVAQAAGASMTQQASALVPPAPRMSPEDEQLQRLLTETDVYVKYGLRDKAIEHLDKIFAIRADHLPGLEKLKQLQTQTKQPTGETLKRLIARGEEVGHPKVAEWKAELARLGQAKKSAPAPAPAPAPASTPSQRRGPPPSQPSSEGEVILVDEDPPTVAPARQTSGSPLQGRSGPATSASKPAEKQADKPERAADQGLDRAVPSSVDKGVDAPTLMHARPGFSPPNMLASMPSMQGGAMQGGAQPGGAMRGGAMHGRAIQGPPDDEPLERVRSSARSLGSDESFASDEDAFGGALAGGAVDFDGADEPLEPSRGNGRGLPPDERLADDGFLPSDLGRSAERGPPREVPRAPTMAAPQVRAAEIVLEDALEADADALVREALAGMPGKVDEIVADDMPADELVLEQEDAHGGVDGGDLPGHLPGHSPGNVPATLDMPRLPAPAFDDAELDALAAAAVAEAMPQSPQRPPVPSASMEFSDDEMGELEKFVENAASGEGAPAIDERGGVAGPPAGMPGDFGADGDDDFTNERTIAYGTENHGRSPVGTTDLGLDDDDNVPTGERRMEAPPAPTNQAFPQAAFVEAGPAPGANDFDPNEFDLPDDVKAMLAQEPAAHRADAFPPPTSFDELSGADLDMPPQATGQFDSPSSGSIPSLASVDADAIEDVSDDLGVGLANGSDGGNGSNGSGSGAPALADAGLGLEEGLGSFDSDEFGPPPMSALPSEMNAPIVATDEAEPDMPSQVRNLFAPARGFEDDPANTFFPDELAEAEFFIQQDLLDEAREILTPILEEVEDSLRVQHMLARVTAKEAGEPEPPAPWEQKLIDEVGQELDDMAALSPPVQHSLPDQVSVEEVLSQFKKGIAETVPEDDAATHYDLGIAYREMGLLEDAVSEFEISSRAPSKSADSWYLVALVRLDQNRADDAIAACEKAFFSATASKDQKAAAEYQRGVVFDDHKKDGREALVCFKRCKGLGGSAPDLDRRIAALTRVHGDVDVPVLVAANGSNGSGGSGGGSSSSKSSTPPSPGRPKNIDYV